MKPFLTFLLLVFICVFSKAQVILQIEKRGDPRSQKIYPGAMIEFKLIGEKEWREAEFIECKLDSEIIIFHNQAHKIKDIEAFRNDDPQKWSKPLSISLMTFGSAWSLLSLGASVVDKEDPYQATDLLVTAIGLGSGYLIRKIFVYKKYVFGKKYRLRPLDISVLAPSY